MYLKEIYLLSRDGSTAKTGAIADRLAISSPSVTEMLERLQQDNLLEYEKHRGARLTAHGEERARSLLRKHCLIERFLIEWLDVEEGFHDEACRMEHAMSDAIATRFSALIDQESDCPDCYDPARRYCARLSSPPD